jgi:hypothetical protein
MMPQQPIMNVNPKNQFANQLPRANSINPDQYMMNMGVNMNMNQDSPFGTHHNMANRNHPQNQGGHHLGNNQGHRGGHHGHRM